MEGGVSGFKKWKSEGVKESGRTNKKRKREIEKKKREKEKKKWRMLMKRRE